MPFCPACRSINLLVLISGCMLHPDWPALERAVHDYDCTFCRLLLDTFTRYFHEFLPELAVNALDIKNDLDSEGHLLRLPQAWSDGLQTPIYLQGNFGLERVHQGRAHEFESEDDDYVLVFINKSPNCSGYEEDALRVVCGKGADESNWRTSRSVTITSGPNVEVTRCDYLYYNSIDVGAKFYQFVIAQTIQFCIQPDDPLTQLLRVTQSSTTLSNPQDGSLVSKIGSWRDDCISNHAECRKDSSGKDILPKRLLNIARFPDTGTLRVTNTSPSFKEQYIALSYCWGLGTGAWLSYVKETQKTKNGYSFELLPRTIQDAVRISSQLGYQYLWVDCLCILQSDPLDWQIESEKMGDIFEQADFTISATASPSCYQGFLHDRKAGEHQQFRLPVLYEPGHSGHLIFGLEHGNLELDERPVSSRAWCLQERILSRRILHWLPHEVYFECRRGRHREREIVKCSHFDSAVGTLPDGGELIRCGKPTIVNPDYEGWRKLAENYSSRRLTVLSDKLVAIAGMAKTMHNRSQDRYLAGHWAKWLVPSLLWSAVKDEPPKRASVWRAPSWSWTSMDTPVVFLNDGRLYDKTYVSILEASTTTSPGQPFGQVTDGKIVLRGFLVSVPTTSLLPDTGQNTGARDSPDCIGFYTEDEVSSLASRDNVVCLRMLTEGSVPGPSLPRGTDVLLLTDCADGTYTRLGVAYLPSAGVFDDVPERVITLL